MRKYFGRALSTLSKWEILTFWTSLFCCCLVVVGVSPLCNLGLNIYKICGSVSYAPVITLHFSLHVLNNIFWRLQSKGEICGASNVGIILVTVAHILKHWVSVQYQKYQISLKHACLIEVMLLFGERRMRCSKADALHQRHKHSPNIHGIPCHFIATFLLSIFQLFSIGFNRLWTFNACEYPMCVAHNQCENIFVCRDQKERNANW